MNNINLKRILVGSVVLLAAVTLYIGITVNTVGATIQERPSKVSICHVPPGNPAKQRTLSVSPKALRGHQIGDSDRLHGLDYFGECNEEVNLCERLENGLEDEDKRADFIKACQRTPRNFNLCTRILDKCEIGVCNLFPKAEQCEELIDVCENIEGVQEEVPEGYEVVGEGVCELIETDPEPTPTPEVSSTSENIVRHSDSSPVDPPQTCQGTDIDWAPTITEVGRIDSDTIYARWTTVADHIDDYIVWYGLSEDSLPWVTKVENSEYVEITLPDYPNQHVWLNVAGTDNCIVGPASITVDP